MREYEYDNCNSIIQDSMTTKQKRKRKSGYDKQNKGKKFLPFRFSCAEMSSWQKSTVWWSVMRPTILSVVGTLQCAARGVRIVDRRDLWCLFVDFLSTVVIHSFVELESINES